MKKLVTEFVKIGQSGPTVDGRTIEASWLKEAAETYNTATYTALIWPDHAKWWNFGKVVALKTVEADGITSLYAKLQPGEYLLSYNKSGQKLFTSMELTPDFAGTGKHYLSGLGVTDIPASLGTTELMFSSRVQAPGNVIYYGVELPKELKTEESEEKIPNWFKKLISGGASSSPENTNEPEKTEEDSEEMEVSKKDFKKLTDSVETMGQNFAALAEKMNPEPDKDPKPSEEAKESGVSSEDFEKLVGSVESMTQTMATFTSRLEKANPGTDVPETHGAADANRGLY